MSSKKILAASLAAVMATGTVASMAMADDATATADTAVDEYTLEIVPAKYQTTKKGVTTATITATLKGAALQDLLVPATFTATVANKVIPAFNGYTLPTTISASMTATAKAGYYSFINSTTTLASEIPTEVKVVNGITEGSMLVKWNTDTTTYATEKTFVPVGTIADSSNPYNNLAMGLSVKKAVAYDGGTYKPLEDSTFAMTNITLTAEVYGKGTDRTTGAGGATEVKADQERKATASATFGDIKGGSTPTGVKAVTGNDNYMATPERLLNPSFNLSGSKTLESLNVTDSSFTVSFDLSLSNESWEKLAKAAGVSWDESGDGVWNKVNIEDMLNKSGDQILTQFLGIEGTSVLNWATVSSTDSSNPQVGHLKINGLGKTIASNVKPGEDEKVDNEDYLNPGVTQNAPGIDGKSYTFTNNGATAIVAYGIAKQNVFKNLNNGGTVTFTFDKEFRAQDAFSPYLLYRTYGGLIDTPVALEFMGIAADNKSITFNFPSGMTWDDGATNPMKNFSLSYNLGYYNTLAAAANSGVVGVAGSGVPADAYLGADYASYFATAAGMYNGHLTKITFKADGAAPSVDGGNSGNGGNTSGSNPGSTSGNPNTGIALAVAPVVLAAGAVVTLASKKRK